MSPTAETCGAYLKIAALGGPLLSKGGSHSAHRTDYGFVRTSGLQIVALSTKEHPSKVHWDFGVPYPPKSYEVLVTNNTTRLGGGPSNFETQADP